MTEEPNVKELIKNLVSLESISRDFSESKIFVTTRDLVEQIYTREKAKGRHVVLGQKKCARVLCDKYGDRCKKCIMGELKVND